MTGPVFTVAADDPLSTAAQQLAESPFHRAVVVDGAGVAVGMVSAIDFLRALTQAAVGRPARVAADVST